MRFILFSFYIININAMYHEVTHEVRNTNNIEKLRWYLNGLEFNDNGELKEAEKTFLDSIIIYAYNNNRILALTLLSKYWKIDKEVSIYVRDSRFPTLLDFSCRLANYSIIVLLTYLGANLNQVNLRGNNVALDEIMRAHLIPKRREIIQFLLSQNAQAYGNEHLLPEAQDFKDLLQSKKRPPIPKEARMLMLDWSREKKNIACTLRKRELGVKK